tara:strand:+ start:217 stop:1221 length:1005 start_codon:yes stop_codon:yes gene_type:complete
MTKVKIIAEAGPNHNGSIKLAYKLVDMAKRCGADYVKFQTSIPALHISKFAKKAKYQKKNTKKNESQLDMAKKIILSYDEFKKLNFYCKRKNIKFLSTAFDLQSIKFLKKFNMDFFKIPSGEITNLMYLEEIGKMKKKVILSTGMAKLSEIREAIKILVEKGTKKKNITILHCNTEYPTPINDVNLRAMITIRDKLKVSVGYSDHTEGTDVAPAAVALGASIIEKHITLNKNMRGPDHKASVNESELKLMIKRIRNTETILGKSSKKPTQSEKKNIKIARNALVAKNYIKKGQKFSLKNLTAKRPAIGISPMKIKKIIGKKAKKNFVYDEPIKI